MYDFRLHQCVGFINLVKTIMVKIIHTLYNKFFQTCSFIYIIDFKFF